MKASAAILSTIVAVSAVLLTSIPADATHKSVCGKKMVETLDYYQRKCPSKKYEAKAAAGTKKCIAKLEQRGKDTLGAQYHGLEIVSAHCNVTPHEAYPGHWCDVWCVCAAEACSKYPKLNLPPSLRPSRPSYRGPSWPSGGKDLRMPSRPSSGGLSVPGSRRR